MIRVVALPDAISTTTWGRRLGHLLFPGAVVALNGPLGAGKTFLVRAIAEGLEVRDANLVTSPTFVLHQIYPARWPIHHFDVYRLKHPEEFTDLGVWEIFEGENISLIEWAERVATVLPAEHLTLAIRITGEESREITLTAQGDRYEQLLGELWGKEPRPMAVYDYNTSYTDLATGFLTESKKTLLGSFQRIAHCVQQLSEDDVWWRPHEPMNAVGNLLLHLCGNLTQWILSGVGGRPDTRLRQQEFDQRTPIPKAELLHRLEMVILEAVAIIERQSAETLLQQRFVQQYNTTILTAIYHAASHLEGHSQEIIYITRLRLGEKYQFLWKPKNP
jgi:tRNA threonylcarbamoyladenosine biosynthesis protein TsaE